MGMNLLSAVCRATGHKNFKGLLEDGERTKRAENLRVTLFNKDLSNETNF